MATFDSLISSHETISPANEDFSAVQDYFSGKTVFLTGSTGFLGKLLVEKLLRTCSGIEKIYILVREKKGKDPQKRVEELFDIPAFERLRKFQPNFTNKISICIGDCSLPHLGLSEKDQDIIINDVNCIFHCAATVRFDVNLRRATYINVRAVYDLLKMARSMKQLTSFVHISTAYSYCPRKEIDEVFYEPSVTGTNLMQLVETFNDDMLDAITPILLDKWPNTYAFTKAVAEEVVKTEGKGLPVSMVRPSIVIASFKEPLPGWIDNIYGPTGVLFGSALGLMRTLQCSVEKTADLVPADYVINTIIAAAWNAGQKTQIEQLDEIYAEEVKDKTPTIYNYVSGCQNPINWDNFMSLAHKHATSMPSPLVVWHYILLMHANRFVYLLLVFFLHTVPAYIVDFFALCIGKKPMLVNAYKKIGKFSEVISFFCTREWDFKNRNVQNLWDKMSPKDKEMFEFDIRRMDWDVYIKVYITGARVYLLKDPLDTIPQGQRKLLLLKVAHYVLVTILCFLLYKLFRFLLNILVLS